MHNEKECCSGPSYQAFQILRLTFAVAPLLAGLDKFFNLLVNWSQYLAAPFNVFGDPKTTMMIVGAVEILVGIGVWVKPKFFAYIVMLWLLGIIVNLVSLGMFYDIALRDFGLALAALALARLSVAHCR